MSMTREELRAPIKKAIDDLLIPGCGREDDTGEPSYHKFTHKTLEDGCYGCDEKLIDWVTDYCLAELRRAREEQQEKDAEIARTFSPQGGRGGNWNRETPEQIARAIEKGPHDA